MSRGIFQGLWVIIHWRTELTSAARWAFTVVLSFRLSDYGMNQIKRDRLDGVDVFAVKEKQIEGRHSDQSYRHNAEHGCMIRGIY